MVNPILKWAGGKRWLVSSGRLPAPTSYDRYVEPFVGSGAVNRPGFTGDRLV